MFIQHLAKSATRSLKPQRFLLQTQKTCSTTCKGNIASNPISLSTGYCSTKARKTFYETENNFIYNILGPTLHNHIKESTETTTVNEEITFTNYLYKDWRSSNATDILNAFKTVKSYCIQHNITVTDPRFDSLVDGLMDHCEKLSDHQLLELLKCISEYPFCSAFNSHNYHDIWSCLDDLCCWKITSWDMETLFTFADVWYKIRLGKIADFIFQMLDKLTKKADTMNKDQLVRIFFYFNVCRHRPVDFEYEYALQHKISEMNVDEMAVVALGYFKSNSKIKMVSVSEAMVDSVSRNALGIHDISLSAIMKALRLSQPAKVLPQIDIMLDKLYPEIDRFSELACLHVALLATALQTCHKGILKKCSQKLVEDLPNLRLKDVERILNVLTMFTYDPQTKPDIFQKAFEELHKDSRIAEFNAFPRCLPSALHYLSLRGLYSYKLMDRVLDFNYIRTVFGKFPKLLPRQLFSLDCSIDVECPDYVGNRLSPDVRYKAAKWQTEWAPTQYKYQKCTPKDHFFLDALNSVRKVVGSDTEEFVSVRHVVPHFPMADIIVCKDVQSNKFTKLLGFERYFHGDVMVPFQDGTLKWYAIVIMIRNNTTRASKNEPLEPLGSLAMKIRHLEKIGYTPVQVIWKEFLDLSPEEKVEYVRKKLRMLHRERAGIKLTCY